MYFIGITGLFIFGGGLLATLAEFRADPATGRIAVLVLCAALSAFLVFLAGFRIVKDRWPLASGGRNEQTSGAGRRLLFGSVLFLLLFVSSAVLLNVTASFFAVPWPVRGLHGVIPEQARLAWGHFYKTPGFVPVNSWGQRDREHTLIPGNDSYRMIFIGDSFLEEGAPVPLAVRAEQKMKAAGMSGHEVINLGVSATSPDEYYFRLKNIGLPLRPRHCFFFFYVGNDFIQEPSLPTLGGFAATYPRDSLLSHIGLGALNHVVMNRQRPLLREWFKGGSLLTYESAMAEKFRRSGNDAETEAVFFSYLDDSERSAAKEALYRAAPEERRRFYDILRHPDDGRFRSYYLDAAVKRATGGQAPRFLPAEYSYRWVRGAAELCRKKGVAFTLVLIPDAFSVDSRMQAQWLPLADMKEGQRYKDEAGDRLVGHARGDGMDVVDLRELLKGSSGTYLNMDGHWSQQGVDLIAGFLSDRLINAARSRVTTGAGR